MSADRNAEYVPECVACFQPAAAVVLGTVNLPACAAHASIARFEGKTTLSLAEYRSVQADTPPIGRKESE
jgi:hypothetical protein